MIRFEEVHKIYPDGTVGVGGITLDVAEHSTTVLLGSSGSGKTTLMRMVNKMVTPTEGRVLLAGADVEEQPAVALRRSIGYVLQDGGLFPHRRVVDNIATVPVLDGVPKDQARKRALDLMGMVGLDRDLAQRSRPSSRVGSASASVSPEHWRTTPRSCSWTSPSGLSTRWSVLTCNGSCVNCSNAWAPPSCSSPTMSMRPSSSAIRWLCCAPVAHSPRWALRRSCSPVPPTSSSPTSSGRTRAAASCVPSTATAPCWWSTPMGVPWGLSTPVPTDGRGVIVTWLLNNLGRVGELLATHTLLALSAIVAAAVLSVPLGRLAVGSRSIGGVVLSALALLYAVPSLPMLVVIPVILGIPVRSPLNMVIVLTLYGIAVLITQVAEAFRSLPRDVIEAANALGIDPWRRFWQVELPLAVPVLVAGLRVVAASTVSLVTVGALVGVQSLGTLFTDGFQRQLVESLLTGLGATLLLALVFDLIIVLAGRLLTPWLRRRKETKA